MARRESREIDHHRAPFFEALLAYRDQGIIPYSTPGHKRGCGAPEELLAALGSSALELDIPIGGGVDDTHRTSGVQREAEALAADAWGADDALFLVNGSSTGNIAFLLATCRPGDTVIVARNLHTSLLSGLILSGASPVYVFPEIDPDLNLTLDVSAEAVEQALSDNPDARAVVLISPSYTGVSSDLSRIAARCRASGVRLFVDEAWGPHFPFHPDLPEPAVRAGASGAVTSIHKLLAGLTQASLLTLGPDVPRESIAPAVSLVETTSPSALIAASIDVARRQMALHGRELLDRTINLAHAARRELSTIPGISVIGADVISGRPGAGHDPTRIMIDVRGTGLTGLEAESLLRSRARIGVEMSDLTSVIAHVTIGDSRKSIDHLIAGFRWLGDRPRSSSRARRSEDPPPAGLVASAGRPLLTPREAAMSPSLTVPLEQASGQVAAETVTPYPPGIPVMAPGDLITQEALEYLRMARDSGQYISGPQDASLGTIRVVDQH